MCSDFGVFSCLMGVPWFSKSLHNLLALFSKNLRALFGTNYLVLFKKKLFGTIWHKLCRRLRLSLAQVSSHPLVLLSSSFSSSPFSFFSCAKQFCHAYKSLQTHQAFNGFEINLVFEYENQQNLLKKDFSIIEVGLGLDSIVSGSRNLSAALLIRSDAQSPPTVLPDQAHSKTHFTEQHHTLY